jgi:tRNA pseudouridine38-40 synthase
MGALNTERLKLIIAYDGRPFSGWQSQAGGKSVQDLLESAFAKICGEDVCVQGSGRTDSGVHAHGQVAHVDVPRGKYPPATWLSALNANLPAAIRVLRAVRVRGGSEGFHARFDAKGKRYVYRIWNDGWMHPMQVGRAWHTSRPIDIATLRAAAALLVGTHDFAGFAANRGKKETSTTRTITRTRVTGRAPLITLTFEGDGFLYKMVRLLTGAIVRIAQGRAPFGLIADLLASKGRIKSPLAAPAEGLYLDRVYY